MHWSTWPPLLLGGLKRDYGPPVVTSGNHPRALPCGLSTSHSRTFGASRSAASRVVERLSQVFLSLVWCDVLKVKLQRFPSPLVVHDHARQLLTAWRAAPAGGPAVSFCRCGGGGGVLLHLRLWPPGRAAPGDTLSAGGILQRFVA